MLTIKLFDEDGKLVDQRSHEKETYLGFKDRPYSPGEKIVVETDTSNQFVWVQVDEAIEPSLVYFKEKVWEFPIITDDELRRAYCSHLFSGPKHYIRAFLPSAAEVSAYRNLARNAHDQKEDTGVYPHAYANVETRNESTFFARNAIDGIIANESHGSYPYQSWGINQQADAQLTIDFGRKIRTDKIALVLRGDYPHDSYWTQVTLSFDDDSEYVLKTEDKMDRQYFEFPEQITQTVTLKDLIKHEDESPFPALTEFEVYGHEVN
ncbi:MAG TPA: hypothetical protein H9829_09295 [Candidatus Tetragenococcus pullicola]|nr:hypothetical protein [Candidatus Tetragenococcus pullicola]